MWLYLIIIISVSYHLSKSHVLDLVCSKKPSCNLVIIPFLTTKSSYLVDDYHQPIKKSLKCFSLEHDKLLPTLLPTAQSSRALPCDLLHEILGECPKCPWQTQVHSPC